MSRFTILVGELDICEGVGGGEGEGEEVKMPVFVEENPSQYFYCVLQTEVR